MEERVTKLMDILKNEYGISSQSELSEALERLETLDISVFCAKRKGETDDNETQKKRKPI